MEIFKLIGSIFIKTDEADKSIDEISKKIQDVSSKLGSTLTKIGDGMTKAGKKLAPVTAGLTALGTASAKTMASFEDGMLKVQSLSGATGEEFEKLTQTAKEFGATTAWSASDVADAMGYMALAGFDTNEILASTSGMLSLASASGEDLATVTDILTDSMTAFGDSASDAERYADVLATTQAKSNTTVGLLGEAFKYVAPLAGSYGYKLEDVSTALGQMANAGVKGSMAGTALSSIITRLGTDTDGCRSKIEEMGIAFYNKDGTARNLSEVLKDLCDATSDLDTAEKASIAKQIAGQEAMKGLLAIMNQGSDAYEDLENKIKNCNGTASDMATNMESGLGGSLRSMKSAIEGASIVLGEKLAPYIKKGADKIRELCDWFQKLSPATQDIIVKVGLLVTALSPALLIVGKLVSTVGTAITTFSKMKTAITAVSTVVKGAGTAFSFLTSPVGIAIVVIGALAGAFIYLWNNCEGFRNFWINLWENIKTITSDVVDAVVNFFVGLWDDISNIWNSIVEAVSSAWDTICNIIQVAGMFIVQLIKLWFDLITLPYRFIWENCKDTIIEIWNIISTWLSEKLTAISEFFTRVWTAISDFFKGVWDAISSYVSEKITAIKEKVTAVTDAIKAVFTRVWTAIKDEVSSIMDSIKEKVGGVWDSVKDKVATVIDDIKSGIESRLNTAKEIVSKILDGIKEKFTSVFDGAKEIVRNAIDYIKGLFDFEWNLPKLKLPHFNISGKFSLDPPSVPKFGIEWYKDGGVMLNPTAFGINGDKLMVGGEAGAEAIAPVDILLSYIRQAVAEQNASLIQCLKDFIDDLGNKLSERAEGDIVIPVYIGDTMIDDIIVNSKKNVRLRSGGLTSV